MNAVSSHASRLDCETGSSTRAGRSASSVKGLSLAWIADLTLQFKAAVVGQFEFQAGLAALAQKKREGEALHAN